MMCRGAGSNCRHHDFQSCALPLSYPGKIILPRKIIRFFPKEGKFCEAKFLVGVLGVAPRTSVLSGLRSNYLSYTPSLVSNEWEKSTRKTWEKQVRWGGAILPPSMRPYPDQRRKSSNRFSPPVRLPGHEYGDVLCDGWVSYTDDSWSRSIFTQKNKLKSIKPPNAVLCSWTLESDKKTVMTSITNIWSCDQDSVDHFRTSISEEMYSSYLPRKEVIHGQLPLPMPCYDFVPIIDPTFYPRTRIFGYCRLSWRDGRYYGLIY